MNDLAYQLQQEKQISFDTYCKDKYNEAFASMDDDEWPDYKDWVSEHYKELEEEWKNEN